MRILIAGGAGYVGNIVIPRLLDRGYEVEVVDLLWFGNALPAQVKVRKKDVLELKESELAGFDQVIFLAGLSNDPMADYSPGRNFVYNAAAPAFLGYLAKRAGVRRFIYASSCSVYGYTENQLFDETAPTSSHYPYGISKLQGELATTSFAGNDFSVIALRKGTICGYSPRMRLDLVVNTMFRTVIEENVIRVNNPAIWRPILAAQDAATAYVRAVECSPGISGVFNVASGNYTLGQLADEVQASVHALLGLEPELIINHAQDIRNYKVSIDRAANVLGFKPRHGIRDIVSELVDHRDEFKDFDDPKFYNIETFRRIDVPQTP